MRVGGQAALGMPDCGSIAKVGIKDIGMHRHLPTRLGLALGLLASVAVVDAASAQEGATFKNLMGQIGIIPKEKDPIQYRERAPLVVPPKTQLRAPSATSASANPDWPTDPEVAARKRKADEDRAPVTWSETRRMSDKNPRLSPYEMQAGRVASSGSEAAEPGSHRGDNSRESFWLNPMQMLAGRKDDEPAERANVEPSRKALTDPPTGMRRSATGKAIQGDRAPRVIDQQAIDASPMAWLTGKFAKDPDE